MIVSQHILSKVPFEPKYDEIKQKINISQYLEKKVSIEKKKFNIKLVDSLALSILIICIGIFVFNNNLSDTVKLSDTIGDLNITTKYDKSDVVIFDSDHELIETFDYVFIGKVIEEVETKQPDGTGTSVPYTFYKIKEIEFLKGEKPEEEGLICFYGGMESKDVRMLCEFNDELLVEGQYYLFIMSKRTENSTNKRIGENDYVLARNDQKVLLEGYDETKAFNEQNENIMYTINRISNILNKKLKTDYFEIPTFNSNQEMVDYYELVAVVQVYFKGIINLEGTGENSDIPAVRYGFRYLYSYKYNEEFRYSKNLYAYNTNFWEEELDVKNYTPLLEDGACYLIFANIKDSNDTNTRVAEDSYVIYDKHQVIKLEGYNPNLHISHQSEEIKEFIQSYFSLKR